VQSPADVSSRPAPPHLAPREPGEGGCDPGESLRRGTLGPLGQLLESCRTGVRVEHRTGLGPPGRARWPSPRGPSAHPTTAEVVCRHHAGLVDRGEGLAQCGCLWALRPPEPLHDAPRSAESPSTACGIAPGPLPRRALGPRAPWTRPAASSALGARGHPRPGPAPSHARPPPGTRCPWRQALCDRLTRRGKSPHRASLGAWMGARRQALRAQRHPGESVPQRGRLGRGHREPRLGGRLGPSALQAARGSGHGAVTGRPARVAPPTSHRGPRPPPGAPRVAPVRGAAGRAVMSRSPCGPGAGLRLCSPASAWVSRVAGRPPVRSWRHCHPRSLPAARVVSGSGNRASHAARHGSKRVWRAWRKPSPGFLARTADNEIISAQPMGSPCQEGEETVFPSYRRLPHGL
jgi:hypothetical protein